MKKFWFLIIAFLLLTTACQSGLSKEFAKKKADNFIYEIREGSTESAYSQLSSKTKQKVNKIAFNRWAENLKINSFISEPEIKNENTIVSAIVFFNFQGKEKWNLTVLESNDTKIELPGKLINQIMSR